MHGSKKNALYDLLAIGAISIEEPVIANGLTEDFICVDGCRCECNNRAYALFLPGAEDSVTKLFANFRKRLPRRCT